MHKTTSLLIAVAAVIVAFCWWRGDPVPMPPSPLSPGEKLNCISYAPFRGTQTPLDPTTVIPPSQIEHDLAQLATLTDCIRIYSVDLGLERVPEIAERHGLKVLLGIWISSEIKRNHEQIATAVALARRFPNSIRALVVGNEVLLRGEMTAGDLENIIKSVRNQAKVPVTYADVWEFWMRNSQLAGAVDFVTVHILPYWEDDPIPAAHAASHIASIHAHVAAAFPGKEVLIGEAGWPSAGRMREGALPSPANQARVLHDLLAAAKRDGFRVNIIEAFDQPWKRRLEGTVGGHWGMLTDGRQLKFSWGQPVSNHPYWIWQTIVGLLFAALVLGLAEVMRRRRDLPEAAHHDWCAIAVIAAAGGALIGPALEAALHESLGLGGWLRSAALIGVATSAPLAAAVAIACRVKPVPLACIIGPSQSRSRDRVAMAVGLSLIVTCILALESALGLTFNPRYLDFPYTALTAAVLSFAILYTGSGASLGGVPPLAEATIGAILAACAAKIIWFETIANWQAVWLAVVLGMLALTLARARVERS